MSKKMLCVILFLALVSGEFFLQSEQFQTYEIEFMENDLKLYFEIPENFKQVQIGTEPKQIADGLALTYIPENENRIVFTKTHQLAYIPQQANLEGALNYLILLQNSDEDSIALMKKIKCNSEYGVDMCWGVYDRTCDRTIELPLGSVIIGCKLFIGKNVFWMTQAVYAYDAETTTPEQKIALKKSVERYIESLRLY